MAENVNQNGGTIRKKLQPVRIKDMLEYNVHPKTIKQPLSVKKRVEPMRVKDLLKSLSGQKKPESAKVTYPSKSADRNFNVPRQNTITSGVHEKNVRRKLYSTNNTPKEVNRQSMLLPTLKTQQINASENINRSQISRKSFLLPPNSIKEHYMRKKFSQGAILEQSHEDASVQTSNEFLTGENAEKPSKLLQTHNSKKNAESSAENLSNITNNNDNENHASTQSTVLFAADTTERVAKAGNANVRTQFQKPSDVIEPKIINPSQGCIDTGYSIYAHRLLENQILLQLAHNVGNPRISHNAPIVKSTNNSESDHVVVERNKILSIEAYLKEGIVNMTQALNLVQVSLKSNSLGMQIHSTVPVEQQGSEHIFFPIEKNLETPLPDSVELEEIKIEPTFGDTTSPTILSLSPTTDNKIQSIHDDVERSKGQNQMRVLRIRLENCFPKISKKIASVELCENIEKALNSQKSPDIFKINDATQCQETRTDDETNRLQVRMNAMNLKRTPKQALEEHETNLLKTPKAIEKNLFMTPNRRVDNKENFQTPIPRRKTFSGLDSQNLRRSVRIARHHLRQSLGDDSFLALERELDILYPPPNI